MWDFLGWFNQNSGAIQAIGTAGLVLFAFVQGVVAWAARNDAKRLAGAAREQAAASVRMAEEMEKGRLFATEPVVALEQRGSSIKTVDIGLVNMGRGPAYNIQCVVKHPAFEMPGKTIRLPFLDVGSHHEQTLHADPGAPPYGGAPLEARYEDQYGKVKFSILKDGVLQTGWE